MNYTISAVKRTNVGKRSKDERAENRIAAVMYGPGSEPMTIAVPRSEFLHVYKSAGHSSLIDLALDGSPAVKVLVKEMQVDPLTMEYRHIDFLKVRMDQELTAEIPLAFAGTSKAVALDGGTLVKSLDAIEVRCLPANLPHEISVDLSLLTTFEDAITVADLKMPAGVAAVTDGSLTIATVARPLTEDELKKLEESAIGDVTAVKSETEEKKAEAAAAAAAEAESEKAK